MASPWVLFTTFRLGSRSNIYDIYMRPCDYIIMQLREQLLENHVSLYAAAQVAQREPYAWATAFSVFDQIWFAIPYYVCFRTPRYMSSSNRFSHSLEHI